MIIMKLIIYLVMFHRGKFNFNDTIKNNIVFDQTIDDKEYLNKIIDLIGINEIPIYHEDKEIGDDGGILSGGQKQRIAIKITNKKAKNTGFR